MFSCCCGSRLVNYLVCLILLLHCVQLPLYLLATFLPSQLKKGNKKPFSCSSRPLACIFFSRGKLRYLFAKFSIFLRLWLPPGFGYLVLITFGMNVRADGGQRSALQICSIACSLLVAKVVSLTVPLSWDALKVNFSMSWWCCGGG